MALEMSSGNVDAASDLLSQTLEAEPSNTKKKNQTDNIKLKRVELAVNKKATKQSEKA